ncbi:MAG TPA: heparan-alpha-glucosaminide N-acetyltransferase domain-containing protein, partial [Candidatus Kapabacteria bacterium]|nr:heparan-alpha-glucosaminide N-acetyltransferase domain-containing protein [Candidatus Kapabacteria bacterium]
MATASVVQKGPRLEFIDLLRGWAVFVMIETHVTNALLSQSYRDTNWFNVLDFFNGLVAPSFLFCAGCGLWIAINRKWDDYINFRKPLWKYLGRMLWILGAAYALHLPNFSLHRMLTSFSAQDAETLFQVDILHTIVITSLFSVLIILITRNKKVLLWSAIICSAALIAIAAPVWAFARGNPALPVIVRDMLTEVPGSYFPFVPWSAFVFIGIIVTKINMDMTNKPLFFRRLFITGGCVLVVGGVMRLFYNPYPWELWRSTPIFFAMRIGVIFMLYAALWLYSERSKEKNAQKKFRLILLFGRESLLVYVTHLIIVYGSVANNGIASKFAATFTPLECLGVSVILIAAMAVLAYVWSRM